MFFLCILLKKEKALKLSTTQKNNQRMDAQHLTTTTVQNCSTALYAIVYVMYAIVYVMYSSVHGGKDYVRVISV